MTIYKPYRNDTAQEEISECAWALTFILYSVWKNSKLDKLLLRFHLLYENCVILRVGKSMFYTVFRISNSKIASHLYVGLFINRK